MKPWHRSGKVRSQATLSAVAVLSSVAEQAAKRWPLGFRKLPWQVTLVDRIDTRCIHRLHAADEERIVIVNAIEVFRQRHGVLNGQVHAAISSPHLHVLLS